LRKRQKPLCITAEDRGVLFAGEVRGRANQRVYVVVPHIERIIGADHDLPGTNLID